VLREKPEECGAAYAQKGCHLVAGESLYQPGFVVKNPNVMLNRAQLQQVLEMRSNLSQQMLLDHKEHFIKTILFLEGFQDILVHGKEARWRHALVHGFGRQTGEVPMKVEDKLLEGKNQILFS